MMLHHVCVHSTYYNVCSIRLHFTNTLLPYKNVPLSVFYLFNIPLFTECWMEAASHSQKYCIMMKNKMEKRKRIFPLFYFYLFFFFFTYDFCLNRKKGCVLFWSCKRTRTLLWHIASSEITPYLISLKSKHVLLVYASSRFHAIT